jgi:hypothetical protein
VIVRISGTGQYDVPDDLVPRLHELDGVITQSLHAGDEKGFHGHLHELVRVVKEKGTELGDETMVPSQIIIPPEDVTLDEAHGFFHNEDYLEPVQA